MAEAVRLNELQEFLWNIHFPISVVDLARKAASVGLPKNVIIFLTSLDPEQTLPSEEDLLTRAEEANLLESELSEAPPEFLYSNQE